MNQKLAQTYQTGSIFLFAACAVGCVAAGIGCSWLFSGPARGTVHAYPWLDMLMPVAICCGALYLLYRCIPTIVRIDPVARRYAYSWGIGPFKRQFEGSYTDLDCVYVNELTTIDSSGYNGGSASTSDSIADIVFSGAGSLGRSQWNMGTSTTHDILLMWTSGMRVKVGARKDIMAAESFAEQLAADTDIPYGGIYDHYNGMWIEGPFHKKIHGVDEELVAEELDGDFPESASPVQPHSHGASPNPPAQHHAEHAPADIPAALGDDAGLNQSDMWK